MFRKRWNGFVSPERLGSLGAQRLPARPALLLILLQSCYSSGSIALVPWLEDRMLTAPEYYSTQPLTPEQEATFFNEVRLANGVCKTTADHRMDDLNEVVLSRWHATAFRPKEIMDVGVSSGITTVEWLEALSGAGLKVRVVGTDVSLSAHIVPLWPGAYAVKNGGWPCGGIFWADNRAMEKARASARYS